MSGVMSIVYNMHKIQSTESDERVQRPLVGFTLRATARFIAASIVATSVDCTSIGIARLLSQSIGMLTRQFVRRLVCPLALEVNQRGRWPQCTLACRTRQRSRRLVCDTALADLSICHSCSATLSLRSRRWRHTFTANTSSWRHSRLAWRCAQRRD